LKKDCENKEEGSLSIMNEIINCLWKEDQKRDEARKKVEKQLKSSDHNTSLDKSLSRIKSNNRKPTMFKENESMHEYFSQPIKQQSNQ
jgi:hypothetical protein